MSSLFTSAGFKNFQQACDSCSLQRWTFNYMEKSTERRCKDCFCTLGGEVSTIEHNECDLFHKIPQKQPVFSYVPETLLSL